MPRINLWASPPSLDLRTPDTGLLSQQQSAQSPAQQNCQAAQWQANESGRCDCSTGLWIRWAAHAPIGDSRRSEFHPREFVGTCLIPSSTPITRVVCRHTAYYSLFPVFIIFCIMVDMDTLLHRDALSRFGYALSDSTRTQVLLSLRETPGYPSDLADQIGVSRQILSNHLACLRGCGLVVAVPEGRRTRYELADPRIGDTLGQLMDLVLAVDPTLCPKSDAEGCC